MASAAVLRFGKHLKELRIHLCQKSNSSKGVRYLSRRYRLRHSSAPIAFQPAEIMSTELEKVSTCLCLNLIPLGKRYQDFIEQHYVTLKKSNPQFPVLIRECSGVQPKIYARYEFGKEDSRSLMDLDSHQVFEVLKKLANQS